MKSVTGVIVALEGDNQPAVRAKDHDASYLESNIQGGGLLTELAGNHNTLKADVVDTQDALHRIAIPAANFMQIGETISVVHDDDGCEVHFTNHSSGRKWSYSRCPTETRKYTA